MDAEVGRERAGDEQGMVLLVFGLVLLGALSMLLMLG